MNKDQILITFYIYYLIHLTHLTLIDNPSNFLRKWGGTARAYLAINWNGPAAVRTDFCPQVRPTFWAGGEFSRQLPAAPGAKVIIPSSLLIIPLRDLLPAYRPQTRQTALMSFRHMLFTSFFTMLYLYRYFSINWQILLPTCHF
jgi:hypothetical protein